MVDAHAAARIASRAAGHAVATAHMADYSLGALIYAQKAIEATGASVDEEQAWQIAQRPHHLRELVISARERRLPKPRP